MYSGMRFKNHHTGKVYLVKDVCGGQVTIESPGGQLTVWGLERTQKMLKNDEIEILVGKTSKTFKRPKKC